MITFKMLFKVFTNEKKTYTNLILIELSQIHVFLASPHRTTNEKCIRWGSLNCTQILMSPINALEKVGALPRINNSSWSGSNFQGMENEPREIQSGI